jgi:hypothetical protein
MACWTISVSKSTDLALRQLFARHGMKESDISQFVEEAVKWRIFDLTVSEIRNKFSDLSPNELQEMIDEACQSIRS